MVIWITARIVELIHAQKANFWDGLYLLDTEPISLGIFWMIHNKRMKPVACAGAVSFKFLTYQLPTVGYWPTVAMTGNGELGFDSEEGA